MIENCYKMPQNYKISDNYFLFWETLKILSWYPLLETPEILARFRTISKVKIEK